jgi:hypothetical protein
VRILGTSSVKMFAGDWRRLVVIPGSRVQR